jgi:DeoR family fructose operon transcriptional repressor
VIVLADHTKLGRDTMCQTVPTQRIDLLVTDSGADPVALQALTDAGVHVVVADHQPAASSL